MAQKPEDIRTVVIAGHGGAGKTTLAEAVLFDAGVTTRLGKIEDGNTTLDFSLEEQKRQISINAALATVPHKGKTFYLLDSPGYADFTGEMRSCMYVADGVVLVASAVHGVEVQTENAWESAAEHHLPVAFYLSKMGRENADFFRIVGELQKYLSEKATPLYLPIGAEAAFKGVVDLLHEKAYLYKGDGSKGGKEGPVPDDMAEAVKAARDALVERIVEADDELMMRYLDGEQIGTDELIPALRKAVRDRLIFPVIPGESGGNVGVEQLMDLLAEYSPAPMERAPRTALEGEDETPLAPDPKGPFVAFCFKVMVDPYVGKLSFLKVLSGALSSDQNIFNVSKGEDERISAFKLMTGKEGKDAKEIVVGEIVAIPKLHSAAVGDTLGTKGSKLIVPPLEFPQPVYSVAVTPKSRADEDKLATAVHKMLEEDPSLSFRKDPETNDNVLSGMGDVHLDIMLARTRERYGVELEVATPRVPYREAIKKPSKAQGKYKKQTGGRGQYGDVHIEFSPRDRGAGFEFLDKVVGGVVPKSFIPAVEKGLREALPKGYLAGYPMVDISAALVFGSYHDVDSSEMAFKIAASLSFKEAMKNASPVLLEPIMNVEVMVPEEYLGDVMGDFNSRRGRIMGIDAKGRMQVVRAQVPLAEMFRYAIILRSMTSGRGFFSMEHSHYDEVPGDIAKKVIEQRQSEVQSVEE